MGYHSKCNIKYSIFLEPHWKFMTDFRHFFGHYVSEKLGKALASLSLGSCDSLHSGAALSSLDYKPHFSKHGVNRIPWRALLDSQEGAALHCTPTGVDPGRDTGRQGAATGLGQTHTDLTVRIQSSEIHLAHLAVLLSRADGLYFVTQCCWFYWFYIHIIKFTQIIWKKFPKY